jgi:hypothetical protein
VFYYVRLDAGALELVGPLAFIYTASARMEQNNEHWKRNWTDSGLSQATVYIFWSKTYTIRAQNAHSVK